MTDEEKLLWDLFCTTGEPRYYSLYARLNDGPHDTDESFGE